MADTKQGRDKQARDAERRQSEREIEAELEAHDGGSELDDAERDEKRAAEGNA